MQAASRTYHDANSSGQTDRSAMSQAKEQWKSANADSQESAETEETLLATK